MQTVDLIYFNAGGGHRAAAQALERVIAEQHRPWTVRRINLVEVLDPRGLFRKTMGFEPEAFYNQRLARGWTLGLAQELKLLQATIRLYHATLVRLLQAHWLATEPDLVVSLVPNFNRALYESLASTLPGVPYMTVLTDMADLPPHFWIEPGQRQHLVCGTPRAVAQARAQGYEPSQISRTSGMILRPEFHGDLSIDRELELRALGLDPSRPVGIVMYGGQGSMQMVSIARALRDTQLILMCGHNQALVQRLGTVRTRARHVAIGFTPDVVRYMRLCDFFIGKPGPGSLSEAVQCGLPVLTFDNAWTMPQERYNTRWVRENGLGLVLRAVRALPEGVRTLVDQLPDFKHRVRAQRNRAVYEVVDIMADQLDLAERPPHAFPSYSAGKTS